MNRNVCEVIPELLDIWCIKLKWASNEEGSGLAEPDEQLFKNWQEAIERKLAKMRTKISLFVSFIFSSNDFPLFVKVSPYHLLKPLRKGEVFYKTG